MTDRSKATTHAEVCWSWGPAHYECAVREIERLRKMHQDVYQRGLQAGSRGLREMYDAIQEVKRQDAWGNTRLTEALMAAEERAERAEAENKRLRAEVERLSRYYKNGIDCFANPCERHSGERTPPFDEFFKKYGGQCLICVVDNNKALKAENEALREALKGADNELDWLDGEMDTCDHSVGVCMCDYWNMRRKMKAALAQHQGEKHGNV